MASPPPAVYALLLYLGLNYAVGRLSISVPCLSSFPLSWELGTSVSHFSIVLLLCIFWTAPLEVTASLAGGGAVCLVVSAVMEHQWLEPE